MKNWNINWKSNEKRLPRISFKEMCTEFNVKPGILKQALSHKDAPKSVLDHRSATVGNSWFEADVVRNWWKNMKV